MALFRRSEQLVLKLTDGGYRRLQACSTLLGRRAFIDVALTYAVEASVSPKADHQPTQPVYHRTTLVWPESPSALSARLEAVLEQLTVPNGSRRQEMRFTLPHSIIIGGARQALKDRLFPAEGLGDHFDTALRSIVGRLEGVGDSVEFVTVPVNRPIYDRARALCSELGLDFDSVVSSEVMTALRRR